VRFFVPLLELHAIQHRAIFSRVTMLESLMMCSHVATAFRGPLGDICSIIWMPQYTQILSRPFTSVSSQSGMPQRFMLIPIICLTAKLSGVPGTPLDSGLHHGLRGSTRLARPLNLLLSIHRTQTQKGSASRATATIPR
jgi:hypothetical protein